MGTQQHLHTPHAWFALGCASRRSRQKRQPTRAAQRAQNTSDTRMGPWHSSSSRSLRSTTAPGRKLLMNPQHSRKRNEVGRRSAKSRQAHGRTPVGRQGGKAQNAQIVLQTISHHCTGAGHPSLLAQHTHQALSGPSPASHTCCLLSRARCSNSGAPQPPGLASVLRAAVQLYTASVAGGGGRPKCSSWPFGRHKRRYGWARKTVPSTCSSRQCLRCQWNRIEGWEWRVFWRRD